jgi:hypothetical protein
VTIEDLAATLPNGFHDARVHVVSVDFSARAAELTLDVWVGAIDRPPGPEREKYRKARLNLIGLEYLAFEPPDPRYRYREAGPIKVDLCDPDDAVAESRPCVQTGFAGRLFVSDWNSFIHFAAADARLDWLETC